jgi:hypothetical protein
MRMRNLDASLTYRNFDASLAGVRSDGSADGAQATASTCVAGGRAREGGGAGSWHRRGEAVGATEGAGVVGEDCGGAAHGGRARRRQEGRGRVRRRGRGEDDAAARGGGAAQRALIVGGGGRRADAQGPGKTDVAANFFSPSEFF